MRTVFIVILFLLFPGLCIAQYTIEGVVRHSDEKVSLPFTHIQASDTGFGTVSNSDGHFNLVVEDLPVLLTISYVGFSPQEILISESTSDLIIELEPAIIASDELLVTDDYEVQLLKNAFQKILSDDTRKYGNAFYRQVTRADTIASEFIEVFYGTEISSNNIDRWKVENGRYAIVRSDSVDLSVYHTNFSIFSRMQLIDTEPFRETIIWPLREDMSEYYLFFLKERYQSGNDTIAVITIEPIKNLDQPLFHGTVTLNETQSFIQQLDVSISHPDFKPVSPLVNRDRIENVKLNLSYQWHQLNSQETVPRFIEADLTYDYIRRKGFWPIRRTDFIKTVRANSVLLYFQYEDYDDSILANGNYFDGVNPNSTDYTLIDQSNYDPDFWNNNSIILRTPVEESIISSFEKFGSFGTMFN